MASVEATAIVNLEEKEARIEEAAQIIRDMRFHEEQIKQHKARLAELDAGAPATTSYLTVTGNVINFRTPRHK